MADDLRVRLEALRTAYDQAFARFEPVDDSEWLQDVWDLLDEETP